MSLKHVGLVFFIFFLFVSVLKDTEAATYYIATNGSDINGNGGEGNPWASLSRAFSALAGLGGNTIIVKDGVYTGDANRITNTSYPPYGSSGAWTIVKAEHDGGAIFDGEYARNMFYHWTSGDILTPKYWQFEGIVWCKNSDNNVALFYSSYVKFLRCGAYEVGDGNTTNFQLGRNVSYILVENCYAYGSGRYKFATYYADHVIFRQCVGRLDRVNSPDGPIAVYSIYNSVDCEIQNSIALDSDQDQAWSNTGGGRWGGFYVPANGVDSNRVNVTRCVSLNNKLGGLQTDGGSYIARNIIFQDCIVWNCSTDSGGSVNLFRGLDNQILNCTFGEAVHDYYYINSYDGIGYNNNTILKNSIIYDITGGTVFYDVESYDYNDYYANSNGPGLSAHDKVLNPIYHSATNPSGALKYLTRIEDGSSLSDQGEGGVDIGATVTKMIGKNGTLWGELDYNTEQGNMWPFPIEDLIRTQMKAYNLSGVNGDRGFCVNGQTLTKYIWEYLGNSIPDDIYGLPAPSNLIADAVSSSTINLSWVDNSANEAGFKIERKSNIAGTFSMIASVGPNISSYSNTGLSGNDTYYYRIRAYNSDYDSMYSNEAYANLSTGNSGTISSSSGGGGGGGCFIASAAYGLPMGRNEIILREFRDRKLLTNRFGRHFVKFYYKHSPPIASYIADRPLARYIVREMLKPIVCMARIILKSKI